MKRSSPSSPNETLSGLSRERLEELFLSRLSTELDDRNAARESLIGFTEYTYDDYQTTAIHRQIAAKLDDVVAGRCKRLIICMPPSTGKSELFSRRLPAYFLGRRPRDRILTWSYNADLATTFGRDVRNIVSGKAFQRLFPDVRLSEDSQSKDEWHTNQNGGYACFGMDGGATGRHGKLLLVDDPFKNRAEAESPVIRDRVWDAYRSVIYTRQIDVVNTAIVVGCTRWHEEDLVGHLDAEEANGSGDRWERLIIPALTPQGLSFCPERFPLEALKRIREVVGPYDWASLYEQRPRPPGGSFFSEASMLVDGLPIPMPTLVDGIFSVIDSAVKTGKEHDGTGVIWFARTMHHGYPLVILDWDLIQIEGASLEAWMPTVHQRSEAFAKACKARKGVLGMWIEDKASGMVLLQQARKHPDWKAQALPAKLSSIGKEERAINVSGYVHQGNVKLTAQAYNRVSTYKGHTKNHLLSQVLGFRLGIKDMGEDDLLDDFSYGVAIALGGGEGF